VQSRAEALTKMKLNFHCFDLSYDAAQYHFVFKLANARKSSYLARHRQARFI